MNCATKGRGEDAAWKGNGEERSLTAAASRPPFLAQLHSPPSCTPILHRATQINIKSRSPLTTLHSPLIFIHLRR